MIAIIFSILYSRSESTILVASFFDSFLILSDTFVSVSSIYSSYHSDSFCLVFIFINHLIIVLSITFITVLASKLSVI
jgi:hypothetical protein